MTRVPGDVAAKTLRADRQDLVARPQSRDAGAHAFDHAGALHPERRFRERPDGLEYVGEVQRGGPNADFHLPRLGRPSLVGENRDAVQLAGRGDVQTDGGWTRLLVGRPPQPRDQVGSQAALVQENEPVGRSAPGLGCRRGRQGSLPAGEQEPVGDVRLLGKLPVGGRRGRCSRLGGRVRLHPVPLALEGVGRQRHAPAPTGPVESGTVQVAAEHPQPARGFVEIVEVSAALAGSAERVKRGGRLDRLLTHQAAQRAAGADF